MVATAVAIVGVVFIVAGREHWKDSYSTLRLRRAASASQYRTMTARLAGLPYAPHSTQVSRSGARRTQIPAITNASYALRESTNRHLTGTALLLSGETEKAIDDLRKVAATGDATALSDLSAALYTHAEEFRSYDSALDAMVAARKAVAASPTLGPAHFNLGLAMQYLGLTTEAGRAFERAASLEPRSEWAAEAQRRAAAFRVQKMKWPTVLRHINAATDEPTRKAVIREHLEIARLYGEGPQLIAWAEYRLAYCSDAPREALKLSRLIGAVLRETHNDLYLSDAVAAIDRAEADGEVTALRMARALLAYKTGREARAGWQESRGDEFLEQAAKELAALGSPVQYPARYYLSGALYEQLRFDDAMKIIESLDRENLEAKGYRAVAARLGWNRGICLLVRGSYAEALQHSDRSHAVSVALGEEELASGLDGNAAQALEYLGRSREAWARRARALRAYSADATPRALNRKAVALTGAANLQLAARNWERAEALLDYALQASMKTEAHSVVTHAFAQRSVARFELGKIDDAESDRGRALNRITLVPDERVRKNLEAEINIATSAAKMAASPKAAIAHLTQSINHSTSSGQSASLARLYAERARAHEILRDKPRRRDDLRAGLEVVASWEQKNTDMEQRAAISTWGQAMRRDLITLELDARDVAAAFSYADDRHTPANLDTPLPLDGIQRALAPQAGIIAFVTTRDRVIVFVIRNDSALADTLPASVARITAAAKAMRDADDTQLPEAAANLHELVFTPIRKHLVGISTLAIVSDQELSGLPFGALRDAARDTYLLEHIAIVQAPSASAAITWSQRARVPREERLLAIGASEFDSERYPRAATLPEVEDEARNVARPAAHSQTLLGRQATPDAVRRALPKASITHYAGHIVDRGADARLLLARADGRDSLTAREVGELRLDSTRVVVLAACRGSGTSEPTAVVQDMASGFLKAGAPTVIASATDVADDKAPRTMQTLHKFLRNGGDGADALRSTARLERSQDKSSVPLSVRLLVMGGSRLLVR